MFKQLISILKKKPCAVVATGNQPTEFEKKRAKIIIDNYCRKLRTDDGNDYYNRSHDWINPTEICWNIEVVGNKRYYVFYYNIPSDDMGGYEAGEEIFRQLL